MAKLPALVSALAEVDGRERKTVDHIARTIRERGYITTGKRGSGAAEMTAHQAANLLIALNGADTPKEAPVVIERFRSLRSYFAGTGKDIRARVDSYNSQIKPVQDVMDARTFGEALDALIEDVPDLVAALRSYAHSAYNDIEPTVLDQKLLGMIRLRLFGLDITFRRYAAKVVLYSSVGVEFEADFMQDTDRMESGFYGDDGHDRRVSVNIGAPTLIAAWQALHPDQSLPCIPDRVPISDVDEVEDRA